MDKAVEEVFTKICAKLVKNAEDLNLILDLIHAVEISERKTYAEMLKLMQKGLLGALTDLTDKDS